MWRPQPRPLSGPDADGLLDTSLPARWRALGMSSPEVMPDRRVQARLSVDQGFPAAPADPARDAPLSQALPGPRRRRARVRPSQGRLGACSAARPWTGSGSAARRPDHPREALVRAQSSARRADRGLAQSARRPPLRLGVLVRVGDQRTKRITAMTMTPTAAAMAMLRVVMATPPMVEAPGAPEGRSGSPTLPGFASRFARAS